MGVTLLIGLWSIAEKLINWFSRKYPKLEIIVDSGHLLDLSSGVSVKCVDVRILNKGIYRITLADMSLNSVPFWQFRLRGDDTKFPFDLEPGKNLGMSFHLDELQEKIGDKFSPIKVHFEDQIGRIFSKKFKLSKLVYR